MKIRAITLHQPWATLIALGVKIHETRSWAPSAGQLRPGDMLAIHAGKKIDREACRELADLIPKRTNLEPVTFTGAVLCICRFEHASRTTYLEEVDPADLRCGDWSPGRFAWQLELVEVFDPPIPQKGAQGLWWWDRP